MRQEAHTFTLPSAIALLCHIVAHSRGARERGSLAFVAEDKNL